MHYSFYIIVPIPILLILKPLGNNSLKNLQFSDLLHNFTVGTPYNKKKEQRYLKKNNW